MKRFVPERKVPRAVLLTLIVGVLTGLVAVSGFGLAWPRASATELLDEADEALQRRDYGKAAELAAQALERDAHSVPALLTAGKASVALGRSEQAFAYYRQLPENASGQDVLEAFKAAGQRALRMGRASDAEYFYTRALQLAPRDVTVNRRLGVLLLIEGRRQESMPRLFELVRGGSFSLEDLCFLGNVHEIYEAEISEFFLRRVPDDLVSQLGTARVQLFRSQTHDAEELIRRILEQRPDLVEAHVQLGGILLNPSREAELVDWLETLPAAADEHPEVWMTRSMLARRWGDLAGAIRCAWEAVRCNPNEHTANYQLGQLLLKEMPEAARRFAERAARLEELNREIHWALKEKGDGPRMLRCARLCEDLGRPWEAWAWHVAVETYHPQHVAPGERERLRAMVTRDTPQTLPSADLARQIDLSHYPLPNLDRLKGRASPSHTPETSAVAIRFEDVAPEVGLNFQFFNGAREDVPGLTIFQSTGGGEAVIDFDRDGWPDLYFVQAGDWPRTPSGEDATNRLYRNLGGRFEDVTVESDAGDRGFGFGAAAGDFDVDGFADLYVANARRNTLLRNNGDGTFSDVTEPAGLHREEWTASSLIADLNGDGLPDLYDVNYCTGDAPFIERCTNREIKQARTCVPSHFTPAPDHVLMNRGDGSFEDVSETAIAVLEEGRGLGIIAADFDGTGLLDLYVGNDLTANFLFMNTTASPGASPVFEERGVLSGCAYDADGVGQASMGIAADDADGDGLIDLFLTHFYHESNTFYHHRPGTLFVDDTLRVDLREPSMTMLGWGTQFIDAELDGRPDLVVANGHIDDYRFQKAPYRMRPQFFSNRGARFAEVKDAGPFFAIEQHGRGLVRLDWNRDGREDFAVSRLFDPAALVANRTPQTGHYLAVRLVGTQSRDAIGAEVRVSAGDRTLIRQMTAGDGYAASNQRQLVFGLGESQGVDEVRIRWPGGAEETFGGVECDEEVLFVEGAGRPFVVPGSRKGNPEQIADAARPDARGDRIAPAAADARSNGTEQVNPSGAARPGAVSHGAH